jgi:hypothetical protein
MARDELPGTIDPAVIVDRIAGPIFYHHLILHTPLGRAEIVQLVDDVLAPFRDRGNRRGRS